MLMTGIYGASGFGREILPLIKQESESRGSLVFIDDGSELETVNDTPVLSFDAFLERPAVLKRVTVAISDSAVRKILFTKLFDHQIQIFDVVAPNVCMFDCINLGTGYILAPFVTLTSNIQIGVGFHANLYSYVGHDCRIGNFVTFAPGVKCNGNVVIEDNVYLGTGVIIKQGSPNKPLVIGEGSVVGMGAVVSKSLEPNSLVVPQRSKVVRKRGLV